MSTVPPQAPPPSLRLALFGATGAAGSGVLRACLDDPRVAAVTAIVRSPLGVTDPRLRALQCADFLDLSPLAEHLTGLDACMFCLGVSQSQVPDPVKYREITYGYALAAGRALRTGSPGATFHFLSGGGTDLNSRWGWAQVKAEAERDLGGLGLAGLLCWRPGYIHTPEPPAKRYFAERLGRALYPLLRVLPGMAIESLDLGRAMLQSTLEGRRTGTIENSEIRAIAARYAAQRGAS